MKKQGLINDDLWLHYLNPQTGNAPLYTKNYSDKEMIFLAQLARGIENSSPFTGLHTYSWFNRDILTTPFGVEKGKVLPQFIENSNVDLDTTMLSQIQ